MANYLSEYRLTPDLVEKSLSSFSSKFKARLKSFVLDENFSGLLPTDLLKTLQEEEGVTLQAVQLELLALAKLFSRPFITGFQVGCICAAPNGDCFLGANLEIPARTLGFSVHAEQSAISNARHHGATGVASLTTSAAPCGHCRQFIGEIERGSEIQIQIPGETPTTLGAILPLPFKPEALGPRTNMFGVPKVILRSSIDVNKDPVLSSAIESAARSYAPYTKSYSGAAIVLKDGRVFSGEYIENVAFNPSLSPLQSACVSMIFGKGSFPEVSRVVLSELTDPTISQVPATLAVVEAVCPSVELETVYCRVA